MGESFFKGKHRGIRQISSQRITANPEYVIPIKVELRSHIAQFIPDSWDPMDADVLEVHRHFESWSDKAEWPGDIGMAGCVLTQRFVTSENFSLIEVGGIGPTLAPPADPTTDKPAGVLQDELFHFDKPLQLYAFSQLQSDR
jgi:hypothetical protein